MNYVSIVVISLNIIAYIINKYLDGNANIELQYEIL